MPAAARPLRLRRQRAGTHAVEVALLFPFFVSLMAGFIDLGWLFFQQSAMDSSVAVGCRQASLVDPGVDETDFGDVVTEAETAILAAIVETGGGDCDTCEIEVDVFGSSPARSLLCTARRSVQPLTGMTFSPVTLDASIAVRMEWQRGG